MNKIIVANGKIIHKDIDATIKVEEKDSIQITLIKNTTLFIENQETKIDILVEPEVCATLLEIKKGSFEHCIKYEIKGKLRYQKLLDGKNCQEKSIFSLQEVGAALDYSFSTISDSKIEETIHVTHIKEKTTSNVICHGAVCGTGILSFKVLGEIPKGAKRSILNQDTKIRIKEQQQATIKPILLIDEQDVEARHACAVGSLEEEQLFYLMSRGIPKEEAEQLLLISFLKNGMSQKELVEFLMELLQKKWR